MRSLEISDAGSSYLASFLNGEAGLCAKLLMCSIKGGRYTTYVPSTEKIYDINRIHAAGLLSAKESNDIFLSFPAYLKNSDAKFRNGTLIIQSPWSQPVDAVPRSLEDRHLLQAGFGVCHTCRIENLDEDEFGFMIGDTIAMRYVACVVDSSMTIAQACLASERQFCDAVIAILVPAYDGESILMWERHG